MSKLTNRYNNYCTSFLFQELRKTGNGNHDTEDIRNATQSFEIHEGDEFLGDKNLNRGKRHSTPRNKSTGKAKAAHKDTSNKNNDIFDDLQEDRPKHRLKNPNRTHSENHRITSDVSKQSTNDFVILPNIQNTRRDTCFDSSRLNDVTVQTTTDLLEDTYEMPLDASQSVPQKSNCNNFVKPRKQQFVHEGNDKEFIQQQQLWLLNGSTSSSDKLDREVPIKQDIEENYIVNSDAPMTSFEHEHQNNIYMEVESLKQLKRNPST